MAEQPLIDRLDEAVDAILTRPRSASVPADPELAALWRVAVGLLDLPAEGFRARLEMELNRRAESMKRATTAEAPVRAGFHSITPYLIVEGADRLIDFLKQAFGAEERLRVKQPDGSIRHAEVRIGDSMVELADGGPPWNPRPSAIHLYVEDADAAYTRAMQAGATSLVAPTDMPYGDREGDVKDPFGNNWYIGTYQHGGPIPPGLRTVNPALHLANAARAIDFLREAFDAEVVERDEAPGGTIAHAKLKLGDSIVELSEARRDFPAMPLSLHYYVPDADAVYARALRAGASSLYAPVDMPYGERSGGVVDPFGNHWFIATPLGEARP